MVIFGRGMEVRVGTKMISYYDDLIEADHGVVTKVEGVDITIEWGDHDVEVVRWEDIKGNWHTSGDKSVGIYDVSIYDEDA